MGIANLDLLSVGIAVASIGILGVVVFLNNTKSSTSKNFLLFSIVTICWGIVNYSSYQATTPEAALWLVRIVLFFAAWQALSLFRLFYVFPEANPKVSKLYIYVLPLLTCLAAITTLTPFTFKGVLNFAPGKVPDLSVGPGIIVFGVISIGLIIAGLVTLLKKHHKATGTLKRQLGFVLLGALAMFVLIIIFNFLMAAFLKNFRFVPLGAVFILPFVAATAYAILKHHLLGAKVIATEILVFVLTIVSFAEVIYSQNWPERLYQIGTFILVFAIGITLIKSVRREVEQREKLEILTKQLAAANERLKELDKQKDQFLSFASHDLKSPINIIKQFASLIADGTYKEPAKIKETVDKIKVTADRAVGLVDDFLDIRKIEEGKMDYNFEAKDIVSFVKGVTEDYALVAKAQKNIAVSFETKIASANVKMDTTRFRQVIQNLLSNSLKYTESGWIKVKITEEQKSILISVQDSGIGMDAPLLPVLFEQFRRDPGVAKKIQGTGLGLYISKQIVLGHGGEIWASSEGKGHGSTFFVRMKKI